MQRYRERFGKKSRVRCNARMSPKQIKAHYQLDEAGEGMMQMTVTELSLSARAYGRLLMVSRTIADLAGSERGQIEHVAEDIQYQAQDRSIWNRVKRHMPTYRKGRPSVQFRGDSMIAPAARTQRRRVRMVRIPAASVL